MNYSTSFVAALISIFCFVSAPAYSQVTGTERLELPGQQRVTGGWDLTLMTEASKSLAEYTDWNGSVAADIAYKIKDFDLGVGVAYLYPFDDKVTVTEDRQYGPEDLELTATYKDLIASPIRSLRPTSYVLLPTSEVSQKATMMTTAAAGLLFSQQEKYFNWNTTHYLIGSAHQYETANAFGTSYNSPIGVSNSIGISRTFNKITLATSYSLYTYYNYANNTKNLQTYRASVRWLFQKDWSVTGYYRWRDDVVSYLSAFNDDTSKAGLFLTYTR